MNTATTFLVARDCLTNTMVQSAPVQGQADLKPGQVLLKVDRFAFTANNISYAVTGDVLGYWQFFPAGHGQGIVPVWGFADVELSRCDGVEVGERLYGYYPMSTHLLVEPQQLGSASFIDGAAHRQGLSVIYNQYIRCAKDPLYHGSSEALQMLLRPLFTTSFLLDGFFEDNQFFAANTIVLTSASSKTALGLGFLLHHNREKRGIHYQIVGLTSAGNMKFVQGLGCYDKVLGYDQIDELAVDKPTVTVDFTGNAELLSKLHNHLPDSLKYSCLVGATHWDQRAGRSKDLAGPSPKMFFAPSHAEKRISDWGGAGFQIRISQVWTEFAGFVDGWMDVEEGFGADAVETIYHEILAGRVNPQKGYILSMWKESI